MDTKVLLPHRTSKGGASLKVGSVMEAVEVLEIEKPIEVKWANGTRRRGSHRWRNGVHVITLSTYMDAKQCSFTLWHELTHCAQCEREGLEKFNAKYRQAGGKGAGYRTNRYEVEANETAEAMEDEPLAKQIGSPQPRPVRRTPRRTPRHRKPTMTGRDLDSLIRDIDNILNNS